MVGACDPNPDARAKMAGKFGIAKTFADFDEMLEATRPEVALIATPPATHFSLAQKAMASGAHVFCEKPFMATLEEADWIIAFARERNLLLRVNNQYRYMSIYADTKRRLAAGEFGRVHYIQCWQQMFHPPASENNWRRELTRYVLYEFSTHVLDLMSFFFDDLPASVNIFTPRCRPEFHSDVLVSGILRFPGERLGALSLNRISHAPERYLEMRLDCEEASVRISLGGVARAAVEWSRRARRPAVKFGLVKGGQTRVERDGRSRVLCSAKHDEWAAATAAHLRVFLSEMQQPKRPLDAALHAREILHTVFMGYDSAQSGETIWRNPADRTSMLAAATGAGIQA